MKYVILLFLVAVLAFPVSASEKPGITSWSNDRTGDDTLVFSVNTGDIIGFNVTSDQVVNKWKWSVNGNVLIDSSTSLFYGFTDKGAYRVEVSGSNDNGITQTITWEVQAKGTDMETRPISWSPGVVNHIYINDTTGKEIEYLITTSRQMTFNNWTVDRTKVEGVVNGNTSLYVQTWDSESAGFHTITYFGSNHNSAVEFRWYINVYRTKENVGGNIFDVIDNALEEHIIDLKVRMFKYRIDIEGGNISYAKEEVNKLQDEITRRQSARKDLRNEFKAGNISIEDFVSAMKQSRLETKNDMKLAREMAKIAKEDLNNDKISMQFENISRMDNEWDTRYVLNKNDKSDPETEETFNNENEPMNSKS